MHKNISGEMAHAFELKSLNINSKKRVHNPITTFIIHAMEKLSRLNSYELNTVYNIRKITDRCNNYYQRL